MAGAPGAGKSQGVSAVQQALGPQESHLRGVSETGYTTVDADDIKQILLGNPVQALELDPDLLSQARTHWEGVLSDNASAPLADGRPLARGELATLVHEMSTSTADQVRADLVADRFGIKIEGTLQWMDSPTVGQGPTLIRELERADYSQVTIVAIDTPEHMCLEGARTRWEIPRSQGDPTARYTPPAAVTGMFTTAPDGTRSCRCIDNARATHHLAARSAIIAQTDLFITHRDRNQPTLVEHVTRYGETHMRPTGPGTRPIEQSRPGSALFSGIGASTRISRDDVLQSLGEHARAYRQQRQSEHRQQPGRNSPGISR